MNARRRVCAALAITVLVTVVFIAARASNGTGEAFELVPPADWGFGAVSGAEPDFMWVTRRRLGFVHLVHRVPYKMLSIGWVDSGPGPTMKAEMMIMNALQEHGIPCMMAGSLRYGIDVPDVVRSEAEDILRKDSSAQGYTVHLNSDSK